MNLSQASNVLKTFSASRGISNYLLSENRENQEGLSRSVKENRRRYLRLRVKTIPRRVAIPRNFPSIDAR